mmetsp:Transcript_29200/g.61096  ORF Transcript_29200/g.61096 Transcript_29200/m.61096 type:complete len:297 (-) Transcript_29200:462-1352(-)
MNGLLHRYSTTRSSSIREDAPELQDIHELPQPQGGVMLLSSLSSLGERPSTTPAQSTATAKIVVDTSGMRRDDDDDGKDGGEMADLVPEERFPLQDITTSPDDVSRLTMGDVGSGLSLSSSFESTCTECSRTPSSAKQIRMDQQRHKLMGMVHASTCTTRNCTEHRRCAAAKRLYSHITNCQLPECFVPGCLKSRRIWWHFCQCEKMSCGVCSVIPAERREALRQENKSFVENPANAPRRKSRSGKRRSHRSHSGALSPASSTCSSVKSPGRPPLSPNKPPLNGGLPRKQLVMMEV